MNGISRGILKTQKKDGKKVADRLKKAKFDKLNVLETMHSFVSQDVSLMHSVEGSEDLDLPALMNRLNMASDASFFHIREDSDDSPDDADYEESIKEKIHNIEFTRRRKMHYTEYFSVPLARRLISEEWKDLISDTKSSSAGETFTNGSDLDDSESCMPETCEFSESFTMHSGISSIGSSSPNDSPGEQFVEPGTEPGHPCYEKLQAELKEFQNGNSFK